MITCPCLPLSPWTYDPAMGDGEEEGGAHLSKAPIGPMAPCKHTKR